MKRKFAVAAATAALITASLSFTAFAANPVDITSPTPEGATTDYADKVVVKNNPAGDTFEVVDEGAHVIDAGFIKVDGKVYHVDGDGKFTLLADGKYTVSDDEVSESDATVYVKDGKVAKSTIITIDGKDYITNATGDNVEKAATTPVVKQLTVTNGNTTTTYSYLVNKDGEIIKGWFDADTNTNDTVTDWYYAKEDGTAVENQWISTSAGRWYFVGKNGQVLTSADIKTAADGTPANYADTAKVTLKKSATAPTGSFAIIYDIDAKKSYVVDENGLWMNGWQFINKEWYYFTTNGVESGWAKIGTKWSYIKNFKILTNCIDKCDTASDYYAFDTDGYMITGFGQVMVPADLSSPTASLQLSYVYANEKGILQSGYQPIGDDDYFFGTDATDYKFAAEKGLHTAVKDLDGDTVADDIMTDRYGKVIADWWIKLEGTDDWYYVNDKKVVVKNAWVAYGKNAKCYMTSTGKMVSGGVYKVDSDGKITETLTVADKFEKADVWNSGKYYTGIDLTNRLNNSVVINEAGAAATKYGWVVLTRDADTNEVTWGFANANGTAYHGWVYDKGCWYFIEAGKMLYNAIVDGCYLDNNGVWIQPER